MGEFWSLTKEERKRCVEIVVEEAKRGGCKVIAHTAHHSAHETVELTLHAQNVGADFVILMNQYYPPASEQTMYEWFKFVADRVDIGLWMFDAEYSGYGMSPELTARIAEIPNVCGIKIPRPLDHYAKVHQLLYGKIVAMLALTGDRDGLRFVRNLRPHILRNRLSMLSVIYQIDQHDFAVRNRHTLAELPFDLDVPSWEARPVTASATGGLSGAGLPILTAPLN